ncbi:hypothetical protein [Methylobacterium sp. A54F]
MTNREMAKGAAAAGAAAPQPNDRPLPPMPAAEDSRTPTIREEPVDSPQPNASLKREAPTPDHPGLATDRS